MEGQPAWEIGGCSWVPSSPGSHLGVQLELSSLVTILEASSGTCCLRDKQPDIPLPSRNQGHGIRASWRGESSYWAVGLLGGTADQTQSPRPVAKSCHDGVEPMGLRPRHPPEEVALSPPSRPQGGHDTVGRKDRLTAGGMKRFQGYSRPWLGRRSSEGGCTREARTGPTVSGRVGEVLLSARPLQTATGRAGGGGRL